MQNKITISVTVDHQTPTKYQSKLEQMLSQKADQLSELAKSQCREIVKRCDGGEPEFKDDWAVE